MIPALTNFIRDARMVTQERGQGGHPNKESSNGNDDDVGRITFDDGCESDSSEIFLPQGRG